MNAQNFILENITYVSDFLIIFLFLGILIYLLGKKYFNSKLNLINSGIVYLIFLCIFSTLFIYFLASFKSSIAELILEYLKIVISWPIIILFIVLIFKDRISNLLDHVAEISLPGGFSAKTGTGINQNVVNVGESENPDFQTLISEKESHISNLQNITDDLERKLASAEIELDFERIFHFIFSSQIELLIRIKNSEKLDTQTLQDYFITVTQKNAIFVSNNWDLTQYLQFLQGSKLIELTADGNAYNITLKGKVFLDYIARRNYTKYDNL